MIYHGWVVFYHMQVPEFNQYPINRHLGDSLNNTVMDVFMYLKLIS